MAWKYGAVPGGGEVLQVRSPDGSARFVDSTIGHWLSSLHLLGSRLTGSTVIGHWDEDDRTEEEALAELADLSEQIRALDSSTCSIGLCPRRLDFTAEFNADDNTAWTFFTLAGEIGWVCGRAPRLDGISVGKAP